MSKQPEIGGYQPDIIASNIRCQYGLSWNSMELRPGLAREGMILVGEITAVNARKEMEKLTGDPYGHTDVPLRPRTQVVTTFARRHSGTSEYGEVPLKGMDTGPNCHVDLLAAGGVCGKALGIPKTLGHDPTKILSFGILYDGQKPVHLKDFYPPWKPTLNASAPYILSTGTAAEIGKTTTGKRLIMELIAQNVHNVAATKLAGTGRMRDIASLHDAGAEIAYDFPDVGLATTYTASQRYLPAIYTLSDQINDRNPQIIVAECGGDMIEGNIPVLLQDPQFIRYVKAIIHSSTDVLAILGSLKMFETYGVLGKVPIILTYPYTKNFYAIRERLRGLGINFPIFDPMNPEETADIVHNIIHSCQL